MIPVVQGKCVNALSGLYLISTEGELCEFAAKNTLSVNALSGLYLISTSCCLTHWRTSTVVSMPSRAYTSFLLFVSITESSSVIFVSMPSRAYTSFLHEPMIARMCESAVSVNALSGLYLISTAVKRMLEALIDTVSMPSRAYTSFLHHSAYHPEVDDVTKVSMPSRAYTSFLQ